MQNDECRMTKRGTIVRRKSDGALFEPSHPAGYGLGQMFGDLLANSPQWYFLRLEKQPLKWWQSRQRCAPTGEVWEPVFASEFDVIMINHELILP